MGDMIDGIAGRTVVTAGEREPRLDFTYTDEGGDRWELSGRFMGLFITQRGALRLLIDTDPEFPFAYDPKRISRVHALGTGR